MEATPAESTSYRLARIDQDRHPGILCANHREVKAGAKPFYSNSSQLPVNYSDDIFRVLDLQDQLQTKYTGGTVLHVFLGEAAADPQAVKRFIRRVCENYRLPYLTISPTFSVCPSHGYLRGEQPKCPQCGSQTEVYSRVVGYMGQSPMERGQAGRVLAAYTLSHRRPAMKICGLQPITLSDYPGKVAAIVFCQGCNFCCPWCHNRQLISPSSPQGHYIPVENVLSHLACRRHQLDGIVISGGEPTIQDDLPQFLSQVRGAGLRRETRHQRQPALCLACLDHTSPSGFHRHGREGAVGHVSASSWCQANDCGRCRRVSR